MLLVYKGVKNPKVVEIKGKEYSFVPGEPGEIPASAGRVILENASDVFSEVVVASSPPKKGKKKKVKFY